MALFGFSAADRESAYVIDGLMHNEVVKSDIHSTDAFGYTEAIFATSHLTGFSYAPRFKNLKRQRLYIFRSRQSVDRSAWKIKPAAYCDEQHIIQFWDDILRWANPFKRKDLIAALERLRSSGSPELRKLLDEALRGTLSDEQRRLNRLSEVLLETAASE